VTVLLAATGGTIASLSDPETGGVRPAVSAEDLVQGVPELAEAAEIEVVEFDLVSGWNVTPATMLAVARMFNERLAEPGIEGGIVTHGTDTVEETAFLCDLLIRRDEPVAFAAAMRSGSELAADGPRNLLDAARVARAPQASGWGSLVVLNDEIHAARHCVKTDSYRVSAFASPGRGPVGWVTPERLRLEEPPPRFTVDPPESLGAEVVLLKVYTGMGPEVIEAALEATGARGIVLEGTGAGNVPGTVMPAVAAAVEGGIPVAFATRVPTGGVVTIYSSPGGGVDLLDAGAMPAGGLTAAKARLLLRVALSTTDDAESASAVFRDAVEALKPAAF